MSTEIPASIIVTGLHQSLLLGCSALRSVAIYHLLRSTPVHSSPGAHVPLSRLQGSLPFDEARLACPSLQPMPSSDTMRIHTSHEADVCPLAREEHTALTK